MNRPYPPFLLRVTRSSVVVWFLARIMYVLVLMVGVFLGIMSIEEGMQSALHPVWPTRLLLVVLTAVLIHLDRNFAHEQLLQFNFGVPAIWFSATSLGAAGMSDVIVQALILVT